MRKFWMVFGGGPTKHQHESIESAQREACRLSKVSPDTVFTVLEAVDAYVNPTVLRIPVVMGPPCGATQNEPQAQAWDQQF